MSRITFPRASIITRINLLTSGLMILAIVSFAVLFVLSDREQSRSSLMRDARTFSVFSAPTIYGDYIQFYTHPAEASFAIFRSRVRDTMGVNADVASVQLVAANGKILFDSQELADGKYEGPDRYLHNPTVTDAIIRGSIALYTLPEVAADGSAFQYIVPLDSVGDGRAVAMVYSFSLAGLDGRAYEISWRVLALALPLLAVGLALPIVMFSAMVRPLRRLREAAERVSADEYDVVIPEGSHDEVGSLANAFRKMMSDLKQSRESLVTKIDELERANKVMVGRELRVVELKERIKTLEHDLAQAGSTDRPVV